MLDVNRQVVYQNFETFTVAVQVTPTQISTSFTKSDYIDSFYVSVDAAAANNVFIGGASVTIANGIEIVAGGGPLKFLINNQNEHYELLAPLIAISEMLGCQPVQPISIPFVLWDFTQIYLVAAAITTVRIAPFRSMFI
jgi:hypothetical protein